MKQMTEMKCDIGYLSLHYDIGSQALNFNPNRPILFRFSLISPTRAARNSNTTNGNKKETETKRK